MEENKIKFYNILDLKDEIVNVENNIYQLNGNYTNKFTNLHKFYFVIFDSKLNLLPFNYLDNNDCFRIKLMFCSDLETLKQYCDFDKGKLKIQYTHDKLLVPIFAKDNNYIKLQNIDLLEDKVEDGANDDKNDEVYKKLTHEFMFICKNIKNNNNLNNYSSKILSMIGIDIPQYGIMNDNLFVTQETDNQLLKLIIMKEFDGKKCLFLYWFVANFSESTELDIHKFALISNDGNVKINISPKGSIINQFISIPLECVDYNDIQFENIRKLFNKKLV